MESEIATLQKFEDQYPREASVLMRLYARGWHMGRTIITLNGDIFTTWREYEAYRGRHPF